jgi:hypothetical protein
VGVQDVRWDKGGTVRVGDYNFLLEKERKKEKKRKIVNWEKDFLYTTE